MEGIPTNEGITKEEVMQQIDWVKRSMDDMNKMIDHNMMPPGKTLEDAKRTVDSMKDLLNTYFSS